ncbi:MAG TPA: siphovirus Gp157 family protein [Tepidimicrobium sp.]|nr:siphovirus Gp157 family protein [Tepidimicrobium sp.]
MHNIRKLIDDEVVTEDEMRVSLMQLDEELGELADGVGKIVQELKAEANAYDTEIKRLRARKSVAENKRKALMEMLEYNMIQQNKRKIKTPFFSFNIQKNPPSVVILDEEAVPEQYKTYKVQIDKRAIQNAIKSTGMPIAGVELVQKEGLRIR